MEQIEKMEKKTEKIATNKIEEKTVDAKKKGNKRKRILAICCILLLVLLIAPMGITVVVYEANFGSRAEKQEDPNKMQYSDYEDRMTRKEISFTSNKGQILRGYIYGSKTEAEEPKALIVLAHGYLGMHENYLNQIAYFVQNGYEVMGYDNTGTNLSDGENLIGLGQSAIDLDYALRYVEKQEDLKDKPLFLYGHSWGGYAVTSVLNYGHDVKAVVSKSGYNNSRDMLIEYGCNLYGDMLKILEPYAYLYEKIKFGNAIDLNGVKGINTADQTRVLLLHSKDDPTISLKNSLLIHEAEFTNPERIQTILLEDKGHDVTRSDRAITYQKEREEKQDFNWDKEIYYQLDETIMEQILTFYEESLS